MDCPNKDCEGKLEYEDIFLSMHKWTCPVCGFTRYN